MKALSIASTGMLSQQMNVEVISNNIANLNTTGFKRQRAEFQDLLYQNIDRIGAQSSDTGTVVPSGVQIGVGVKAGAVYRIMEQGNLTETSNPYDIAINGKGYFRIQLPTGEDAYTRAGSFQISPQGVIVNAKGFQVQPAITIPPDAIDVAVSQQGEVSVKLAGQVEPSVVGRLELVRFPNEAGLEAIGESLFIETPASGAANVGLADTPGFGLIEQGFLETSNVNAVAEITNLITAQRAYEMNSRVIATADEMMNATNSLK